MQLTVEDTLYQVFVNVIVICIALDTQHFYQTSKRFRHLVGRNSRDLQSQGLAHILSSIVACTWFSLKQNLRRCRRACGLYQRCGCYRRHVAYRKHHLKKFHCESFLSDRVSKFPAILHHSRQRGGTQSEKCVLDVLEKCIDIPAIGRLYAGPSLETKAE